MHWTESARGLQVSFRNAGSGPQLMHYPDKAGIQFQILNNSKGPAVWVGQHSLRSSNMAPEALIGSPSSNRPETVQEAHAGGLARISQPRHPRSQRI